MSHEYCNFDDPPDKPQTPKQKTNFTIMSYNIWFSEKKRTERMISLIENILYHDPDIICLQEVTVPIYDQLVYRLGQFKYHFPQNPTNKYNCVIFSKYELTDQKYIEYTNSVMDRGLVITSVKILNKIITIATSHFESLFQRHNATKLEQFKIADDELSKIAEKNTVILCADTNIVGNEDNLFMPKWIDAWVKAGMGKEDQYTYDSEYNDNLNNRQLGYYRSRIDRIVFLNGSLEKFKLIKGLAELIEPSDHFGVMAQFSI